MKKQDFLLYPLVMGVFFVLASSCEKDLMPVVTTTAISNIIDTTATSGGDITDEGSSTVISRGVCWSTGTSPTINDNKTIDGAGAGSYSSTITGLNGATDYYVRAYASNNEGTGYGMALAFTTLGESPLPTVAEATNITTTSATLVGSVNPNYLSTEVTFEYGTSTSYGSTATANHSPVTGNTSTNVSSEITGLNVGTTYHYRVKAVNQSGTVYSDALTFTTLGQKPDATTKAVTNITFKSATLIGSVNPNYLATEVTFEYGTTTAYGYTIIATQNPVTGNAHISVNADITDLKFGTYHFRVKAENELGISYGDDFMFRINYTGLTGTLTDVDGNVYKTIGIGGQLWMAENLKTTKYNNGTEIPHITNNTGWEELSTPGYCWYDNDYATYGAIYGALYNWYTVETDNLCPSEWHVPTDEEWNELIDFLGGENVAGGKLKETGMTHWASPNSGATNETGFTAFPGGYRVYDGSFSKIGYDGNWWSATETNTNYAWTSHMAYSNGKVERSYYLKQPGFSVRCLRD